jgi:protein O-mannosyl-transferase
MLLLLLLSHCRRVLEVSPNHANTLYNYAVLLDTHLHRKNDAERYYRRAIEIEIRHAYALYNLAVLLEEKYATDGIFKIEINDTTDTNTNTNTNPTDIMKFKQEVAIFYQRAVEADPRDATTLADYARYLFVRMENIEMAEPLFLAALKLENTCEVACYHLAALYMKMKKNFDKAEQLLKELLSRNPQHMNATLTLARLLSDQIQTLSTATNNVNANGKKKEELIDDCIVYYERSVNLSKEVIYDIFFSS